MANYSIFDLGELFKLDSPLTPLDPAPKALRVEFSSASVAPDGEHTLRFLITTTNLNPRNLRATLALKGLPAQATLLTQRQDLTPGAAEYALKVATARLLPSPGAVLESQRFALAVSCDGKTATSAAFGLQSAAVLAQAATDKATDAASFPATAIDNLPHPTNYAYDFAEVDLLTTYAEAYSKGKYPDDKFPDVRTPAALAARADAHADLVETNKLLLAEEVQQFLQNESGYIRGRALALGQDPTRVGPDHNLCIHLYTRQLALLKYGDTDRFVDLRNAAQMVPPPKAGQPSPPPGKTSQLWGQYTQSITLARSKEALLLATLVPSIRLAGKVVPFTGHLLASPIDNRQIVRVPGHPPEGEPTQINPHVGYFLDTYLRKMPVGKAFVFGMGLGHGYHSIIVTAKRLSEQQNEYCILDDHMQHDFCVAGPNLAPAFLTNRKTLDGKVVDYFIQAYIGGAWADYTDIKPFAPGSTGFPLTTDIFLLHPAKQK